MNSAAAIALLVTSIGTALAFAWAWFRGRDQLKWVEAARKDEAASAAASRRIVGALYSAERTAEIAQETITAERIKSARETLELEVSRIEFASPEANRAAADHAINDGLELLGKIRSGEL